MEKRLKKPSKPLGFSKTVGTRFLAPAPVSERRLKAVRSAQTGRPGAAFPGAMAPTAAPTIRRASSPLEPFEDGRLGVSAWAGLVRECQFSALRFRAALSGGFQVLRERRSCTLKPAGMASRTDRMRTNASNVGHEMLDTRHQRATLRLNCFAEGLWERDPRVHHALSRRQDG